jgi:DegV family protein with EDD domain
VTGGQVSRVAVVTDSSCCLPGDPTGLPGLSGPVVVPLRVHVDGTDHAEIDLTGDQLVERLRAGVPLSTSQPVAQAFLAAYERAAAGGAEEIVSIQLSAALSGTYASACAAARDSRVRVHVVDSASAGFGLGFAVRSGIATAASGGDGAAVVAAAQETLRCTEVLFYVDTLEYLRRGGRIGAAAAWAGSALAIKPILRLEAGRIVAAEKVRTAARGLARLAELALAAAGSGPAEFGVQHLGAAGRAADLATRLRESRPAGTAVWVGEVGAAIGAHVGPGTLAVTVRRG